MSDSLKEANQKLEALQKSTEKIDSNVAAQQSDNVSHALAGSGGGLLSMLLTYDALLKES